MKILKLVTKLSIIGIILSFWSCGDSENLKKDKKEVKYHISTDITTTLDKTLKESEYDETDQILPNDIPFFKDYNYGVFEEGEGEPHILISNLKKNHNKDSERKSLLLFAHLTDTHITDVQSPIRSIFGMILNNSSAYRPNSIYSTHVLDAMVQTINKLSNREKIDFTLLTGDLIDNSEKIELDWVNTIMNGGVVTPDSGEVDDPVKGDGNDFTDPFIAEGVDTPWYGLVGNHDVLYSGVWFITDERYEIYTGDQIATTSIGIDIYSGTQNAKTEYGDVVCGFTKGERNGKAVAEYVEICEDSYVVPDVLREPFRDHKSYWDYIKDSNLTQYQGGEKGGYGVIEPKNGVPIIILYIDSATSEKNFIVDGEVSGGATGEYGAISEDQYLWLENQLNHYKEQNYGVIITQHHPINSINNETSEISKEQYLDLLHNFDNILALVTGHSHKHRVTYYEKEGKHNFYQIETASLIDFPQQGRLIELVYNGDNSLSIFSTVIDHLSVDGSLSYFARSLSLAHKQLVGGGSKGDIEDRNFEIVIPITTELGDRFESLIDVENYVRSLNY